MCYNYSNLVPGFAPGDLIDKYKLRVSERRERWEKFRERFSFYYADGFEHKQLPVVTMDKPDDLQFFHWGLIPHWTKTSKDADAIRKQTLNARAETIFTLPSFRSYIRSKRCLIHATGFYEWRDIASKKYPYHIMVKDDDFPDSTRDFYFGGIYSQWTDKEGGEVLD